LDVIEPDGVWQTQFQNIPVELLSITPEPGINGADP
jgi:hypothetical protein